MKNLKRMLSAVVIALVLSMNTVMYAYTGIVDVDDNIQISNIITNGKGTINITRDVPTYKLSYQWVEINNDLYKQIKKLKDELLIIQYFNIYEMEQNATNFKDQNSPSFDVYISAQAYYKNLYGNYFTELTDIKANENRSIINSLLPEQSKEWISTTDNTFSMDLTSFSGTKDFCVWVQLEKVDGSKAYDAEIFEFTGTKQEENNDDGNKQEDSKQEENKDDNNKQEEQKEEQRVLFSIDPNDNIIISKIITNGKGIIDITRDISSYRLSYQWVEINNDLYKQIKRLKDELQIIQYFNIYEMEQTDQNYDVYKSSQEYYKNLYGQYFTNLTSQQAQENISIINSLLGKPGDTWILTTDNTFSVMDLSQFTGTKDYILWAQIEKADGTKTYDGEIFEFAGTKQDEPKQDEPKQDEPKQDEPKQDEPKQDEPKQDEPKQDEPKQDEPKQDEPKQDEPKQDEPKQDEPKQDEPKQDEPKQDEPKQDEPKQDEPKQDEPKQDEPKQDEPKQDEPKTNNSKSSTTNNISTNNSSSNATYTGAKTDTSTISGKLPYTGATQMAILSGIGALTAAAALSYVKYRKIK